jgi:hypothetical protein
MIIEYDAVCAHRVWMKHIFTEVNVKNRGVRTEMSEDMDRKNKLERSSKYAEAVRGIVVTVCHGGRGLRLWRGTEVK